MTAQTAVRRRFRSGAFLIGSLIALGAGLGPAAPPVHAQIDIGFIPVTGTWSRGGTDTVAWLDLATWKLATSFTGGQPSKDPGLIPWIPVAGDWDGDGVDSVQMFNVRDWRLVPAERGPLEESAVGDPIPWSPVAGDWNGDGIDSVLVFDQRDGSLHRLAEGPIPFDRYNPGPNPWMPVAGDWDGDGVDTLATLRNEPTTPAPAPVWVSVSGDWDGDGIDSAAALHTPSGQLVQPEPETSSRTSASSVSSLFGEAFQMPNGCYWTIKNQTTSVIKMKYGVGGCMFIVMKMWEKWTCCSLSSNGPTACTMKLEGSTSTPSYSNC